MIFRRIFIYFHVFYESMTTSDLRWFASMDLHQYKGEYVILADKQVFAHGLNLKEMITTFRKKYPGKVPAVAKINKEDVLVL